MTCHVRPLEIFPATGWGPAFATKKHQINHSSAVCQVFFVAQELSPAAPQGPQPWKTHSGTRVARIYFCII